MAYHAGFFDHLDAGIPTDPGSSIHTPKLSGGMWPKRISRDFSLEYNYRSDSRDVAHILTYAPSKWRIEHHTPLSYANITAIFELLGDGEILELWATDRNDPYNIRAPYWRIL